jgi:hypothetical protein
MYATDSNELNQVNTQQPTYNKQHPTNNMQPTINPAKLPNEKGILWNKLPKIMKKM